MRKIGMVISLLLLLSSCDLLKEEESQRTLYVAAYGDETTPEGQSFISIISTFEALHPGYRVEYSLKFDEEYHQMLATDLEENKHYDVITTWNGGSRHQVVVNNNEHIDQTQFVDTSLYQEGALMPVGTNGEVYSIPEVRGVHTVFYANDGLISQLGLTKATTYEELLSQKTVANSAGIDLIAYPGETSWCHDTFLYSLIVGRLGGVNFVLDLQNKRKAFNDQPSLDTFSFIKTMVDDGVFNTNITSYDYDDHLVQFNNGEALYFIDGGWRARQVTLTNFSWNAFPAIPNEVAPNSSNGGFSTYGWAITRSGAEGDNREGAITFLKYITGIEASKVRAKTQGSVPAITVNETIEYKPGTEIQGEYIQSLDTITNTVGDYLPYDTNSEAKNAYTNGITEILGGTKTPQEVADETQALY